MANTPSQPSKVEQIIDIGGRVAAIAGLGAPHIAVGALVARFIVDQINAVRTSGEPPIELPPDEELIRRMEASAKAGLDENEEARKRWKELEDDTDDSG